MTPGTPYSRDPARISRLWVLSVSIWFVLQFWGDFLLTQISHFSKISSSLDTLRISSLRWCSSFHRWLLIIHQCYLHHKITLLAVKFHTLFNPFVLAHWFNITLHLSNPTEEVLYPAFMTCLYCPFPSNNHHAYFGLNPTQP